MVSYIKKSLATLAGYGNPDLLPPAEYIASAHDDAVDEEDCNTCSNPCSEHQQFPSYLYIQQDFPILGTVKPYGRHIVIATGTTDWPRRIERVEGTFAHSIYNADRRQKKRSNLPWKNLITNSSLLSSFSTVPDSCDVMIFPDNIIVSNVTCDSAEDFYDVFIGTPLPTTEPAVDIDFISKDDRMGEMKVHKNPYKTLMMLCSHNKVDKRCGITAPILAQELDHVLREKDLDEYDAGIIMVSHIGGNNIKENRYNVLCITQSHHMYCNFHIHRASDRWKRDLLYKWRYQRCVVRSGENLPLSIYCRRDNHWR